MIRDILELNRGGYYIGDFRFDEGVRINESGVSPCLTKTKDGRSISTALFVFEVTIDDS